MGYRIRKMQLFRQQQGLLNPEEEKILNSIHIASENNPRHPEFPANSPKFPATPTYKIDVPGFSDVWLKDESRNPTGTHKDRMAWEIVVTYRYFLQSKKEGLISGDLPSMSIISSGSAAIAIQSLFRSYGLPPLKVLVDNQTHGEAIRMMESIGCKIYKTDLSAKMLNWEEILTLTDNKDGFDITSAEALDPTTRYYDWLSYEIINNNPDYCFVPFGTGHLYENILNINKKEVTASRHDPRFKGDVEKLKRCNFLGATTNDPRSRAAEKLYSPHLPFTHYDEQWIRLYKFAGYCGIESGISIIKEEFLERSIEILNSQGVSCEPSAAAGLALMLQFKEKLPTSKKMLVVSTGRAHLPTT